MLRNAVAALFLGATGASYAAGSECDLPIQFVLRPDQAILYESWDRVPHEFGAGDAVTVDCRDGMFTVNGFVHRPHAPAPPWKVELLRRLYGQVPFVREYVAAAEGDSVTRWNGAARALQSLHRELYGQAKSVYWAAMDSRGEGRAGIQLGVGHLIR
jgi:hypothetical protein